MHARQHSSLLLVAQPRTDQLMQIRLKRFGQPLGHNSGGIEGLSGYTIAMQTAGRHEVLRTRIVSVATPRKQSGCLLSSNRRPISTTRLPSSTASQMRSATCGADSSPSTVTVRIGVSSGGLRCLCPAVPPAVDELVLLRMLLSLAKVACGSRVTEGNSASEGSSVSCSSAAPPCRLRSTSNSRRRIIRSRSADVRFSRARNAETTFEKSERRVERPGQPRGTP